MISRLVSIRPPVLRAPRNALRVITSARLLETDATHISSTPPPAPPTSLNTPKPSPLSKPHDPTIPPTSLLKPTILSTPHTHPVALLHFRTYHTPTLELFLHFAYHAAYALNIPLSHPAALPTKRSLFTVPKSPFIFKKAQENFEKKTHKRAVKVWNADKSVVDVWLRYLEEHMMPGVGMRVVRWEREELGFGERRLSEVESVLKGGTGKMSVAEQVRLIGERIVREETEAAKKSVGDETKIDVEEDEPKSS
ncbi:mitochondrial 37S ribosomal protein rsm10 [Ceratobasidium sp. 428]|nr:mitochondrial 37S ribosomal protein rsm10 [Ceratobasidium sp. 428]